MLRLAIDTGGTFTDCVLQDTAAGQLWFGKTLSTPAAPRQGVLHSIELLQKSRPFGLADIEVVLLATTVATNAILERNGPRLGLITTRGFRDVAILQRAKRYDTYDLYLEKPRPLVRRREIMEVDERVGPRGDVISALDMASVDRAIDELAVLGIEALAVSLLHAYANPAHEQAIAARVAHRQPYWDISISCEVSPKYREYERTSTTLANAYVSPIVRRFLDQLGESFQSRGFQGELYVMQSNGGLLSPELARAHPVHIVESGPAAGVVLGSVVARREALEHVLTFDMGGTTAKVGAIEDGEPAVTTTFEVDGINLRQWSGLPLNISSVELIEIGAGGGSIARAEMGTIQVGPQSAGADPGPVCYGRGGRLATITDANLVLGYLAPDRFAGGAFDLDPEAASEAIQRQVAEPLGLDLYQAAWGVHAVANANMERAMRSMSIERGRDPRDFAMVAFGGAGPVHASRLARSLGIRQVIVPWGAGVGSAVGMLEAEPRFEATLTRLVNVEPAAVPAIAQVFAALDQRVGAAINLPLERARGHRSQRHVYMRYAGQGYELRVEAPDGPIGPRFVAELLTRFGQAYAQSYGYAESALPVEATDWQLTALLRSGHPRSPELMHGRVNSSAHESENRSATSPATSPANRSGNGLTSARALQGSPPFTRTGRGLGASRVTQDAYFPELGIEGRVECRVLTRQDLFGSDIAGPAIVADAEATILILPGDLATMNGSGDLVVNVALEDTL